MSRSPAQVFPSLQANCVLTGELSRWQSYIDPWSKFTPRPVPNRNKIGSTAYKYRFRFQMSEPLSNHAASRVGRWREEGGGRREERPGETQHFQHPQHSRSMSAAMDGPRAARRRQLANLYQASAWLNCTENGLGGVCILVRVE